MNHQLNSYLSIVTNWLLRLTLLCSVFLFSGYVDSDYLTLPTTTQIELVESKAPCSSNFSFLKNSYQLTKQPQNKFSFTSFDAALIAYNQLQKVKFLALKEKAIEYSIIRLFMPRKIITSNFKDVSPAFFIG